MLFHSFLEFLALPKMLKKMYENSSQMFLYHKKEGFFKGNLVPSLVIIQSLGAWHCREGNMDFRLSEFLKAFLGLVPGGHKEMSSILADQ
jgi:hypothetical protein